MTDEKLFEFVSKLLTRTVENHQRWETTTSEEAFVTSFPNHSIKVSMVYDEGGSTGEVSVSIYDQDGTLIETALESDLGSKLPAGKKSVSYTFRRLYEAARRNARNVDAALDDLLSNM